MSPKARGRPYAESAEAVLVAVAATGDEEAFCELVRRRQAWLRALMRRLCRDTALADDLAQQAFLAAWRGLRTLRSTAAFGGWLRKLALNVWLQQERGERGVRAEPQRPAYPDPRPASDAQPGPQRALELAPQAAAHWDVQIDLDAALATLPSPVRLCVVLAYAEGMSHSEIAAATGLPLGTVKSHVARGVQRLRGRLQGYGASGADGGRGGDGDAGEDGGSGEPARSVRHDG